ncbi:MAG: hypothetical protein DRI90_19925 [Deltaproteobacteria bacterium]|nr:MAG: hypothetical protein DRI90_19925 [Deltaproteobacteria bacterium]
MIVIPTPGEIDKTPEVATLTVLDIALEVAIHALVARYPDLEDPDQREWLMPPPASAPLAAVVVGVADTLRCAVHNYLATVECQHDLERPDLQHRD